MSKSRYWSVAFVVGLALQFTARSALAGWQPAVNLGSTVNSPDEDWSPAITMDGSVLYFVSDRPGGQGELDIWMSSSLDGVWQSPVNLGAAVNAPGDEYHVSVSSDGTRLYFASDRAGGFGEFDIWTTVRTNGNWQTPLNLGAPINTSGSEETPWISPDGNALYFASDRAGGYGDADIWVSTNVSGVWQTPVNLGPRINTADEDGEPCISSTGQTLYFVSWARSGGLGEADIWMSKRLGDSWTEPVNLGSGVNSTHEEWHPSISVSGDRLYFETTRPGGQGGSDLWVSSRTGPTVEVATAIEVFWPSESNVTYQAQWASSLQSNLWYDLGLPVLGNGTTNAAFGTIRGIESRFYRVIEIP